MSVFTVFISHTNGPEDMTVLRRLASNLELADVTVYIAEDDRQPGRYLVEKIKEHIQSSDYVIGLWTQDASKSAYVNQELGWTEGKKPYALLVQKGISITGFPEGKEYILFEPTDPTLGLKQMSHFLSKQKFKKDQDAEAAKAFLVILFAVVVIMLLSSK
jgi:hypothetical protein